MYWDVKSKEREDLKLNGAGVCEVRHVSFLSMPLRGELSLLILRVRLFGWLLFR